MNYISLYNNEKVSRKDIPLLDYMNFLELNTGILAGQPHRHCASLFGFNEGERVILICSIADDQTNKILVSSTVVERRNTYHSLTAVNHNFENFEREIHESLGVEYSDHPWLKPYRKIENYPFLKPGSEELHEVGVGPIHAGIIEPGHFRFICNGEQIMHLEISLGYQHRGIEELIKNKEGILERATLAENITGDTVVGHTSAFSNLWESLCGYERKPYLDYTRTLAMEMERVAVHTGDLSALCGDIGYQLGSAVYGRLRTPIVNFMQEWCGNRLSKGLIRPAKVNYAFSDKLAERLKSTLKVYEVEFNEMSSKLASLPSALSRFEKTGVVSLDVMSEIGAVGMAARASGLRRDIRESHPFNLYGKMINHDPVLKRHGDVYSRVQIRREEIRQSLAYIRTMLDDIALFEKPANIQLSPSADSFVISLTEGWRGEICHCALTDKEGKLIKYKIKDPSLHNWMALAQAVRNNEISDFPVCNKSFNLSYCGHDL
ncbi:MAG: NADH-quinone oxidoreductase subunit C [Rikenellaceae bacterium]|nr:NADH-quinone oxidoreductase subunit C [Rikenellaceae bacterium]